MRRRKKRNSFKCKKWTLSTRIPWIFKQAWDIHNIYYIYAMYMYVIYTYIYYIRLYLCWCCHEIIQLQHLLSKMGPKNMGYITNDISKTQDACLHQKRTGTCWYFIYGVISWTFKRLYLFVDPTPNLLWNCLLQNIALFNTMNDSVVS